MYHLPVFRLLNGIFKRGQCTMGLPEATRLVPGRATSMFRNNIAGVLMKALFAFSLIFVLASTNPACADPVSVDAPLLDQVSTRVNDQIFTQQKKWCA